MVTLNETAPYLTGQVPGHDLDIENAREMVVKSIAMVVLGLAANYVIPAVVALSLTMKTVVTTASYVWMVGWALYGIVPLVIRAVSNIFEWLSGQQELVDRFVSNLKYDLLRGSIPQVLVDLRQAGQWVGLPRATRTRILVQLHALHGHEGECIRKFAANAHTLFEDYLDLRGHIMHERYREALRLYENKKEEEFGLLYEAARLDWRNYYPQQLQTIDALKNMIRSIEEAWRSGDESRVFQIIDQGRNRNEACAVVATRNPEWGPVFMTKYQAWAKEHRIAELVTQLHDCVLSESPPQVLVWARKNLKPDEETAVLDRFKARYEHGSEKLQQFSAHGQQCLEMIEMMHTNIVQWKNFKEAIKPFQLGQDTFFQLALAALKIERSGARYPKEFDDFLQSVEEIENIVKMGESGGVNNIVHLCKSEHVALAFEVVHARNSTRGKIIDEFKKMYMLRVELEQALTESHSNVYHCIIRHLSTVTLNELRCWLEVTRSNSSLNSRAQKALWELSHVESILDAIRQNKITQAKRLFSQLDTYGFLIACFDAIPDVQAEQRMLIQTFFFQNLQENFQYEWNRGLLEEEAETVISQNEWIEEPLRKSSLGKLSEKEFSEATQKVKGLLPKEQHADVDAIELLCNYELNRSHLTKGIQDVVIPVKPSKSNLIDLLSLFDAVNFNQPDQSRYYDPAIQFKEDYSVSSIRNQLRQDLRDTGRYGTADALGVALEERMPDAIKRNLRSQLNEFIQRVKNKIAYTGTPTQGSSQLTLFYDTIDNALCHVIVKLKELPDTEESKAIKADTIIQILRAASHCGPRIYEMAIKRYRVRVLEKKEQENDAIYDLLGEYRGVLFESRLPPPSGETIVYYSKLIAGLGVELGIPGAGVLSQGGGTQFNMGGDFDRDRDRKRFFAYYNPFSIAIWVTQQMSKSELIDFCKAHIPSSWQPQAIEEATKMVTTMRHENKDVAVIAKALQEKHEIGVEKGKSPEEAIQAERQSLYLEKEVVEDMHAKSMKIKPRAIINALVAAGVLNKVAKITP